MFDSGITQYAVILLAVAAVIAMKYFTLRSKTNKQLKLFIHPSEFMGEIKKKVPTSDHAVQLLTINLQKATPGEIERIRNIAILVTYLNENEEFPPKMGKAIRGRMKELGEMEGACEKYRQYTLENIGEWE